MLTLVGGVESLTGVWQQADIDLSVGLMLQFKVEMTYVYKHTRRSNVKTYTYSLTTATGIITTFGLV